MDRLAHESTFKPGPKSNEFGFRVGTICPMLIERFSTLLLNDWVNAVPSNKERSRSESFEKYINSFGPLKVSVKEKLRFAIDELIMNGEHYGEDHRSLIHLERTPDGFWLKARDQGGHFKEDSALRLYHTIFNEMLTPCPDGHGAGIGLGMIVKMAEHFQIYVDPSRETVVNCFIPDKAPEHLISFAFFSHPSST